LLDFIRFEFAPDGDTLILGRRRNNGRDSLYRALYCDQAFRSRKSTASYFRRYTVLSAANLSVLEFLMPCYPAENLVQFRTGAMLVCSIGLDLRSAQITTSKTPPTAEEVARRGNEKRTDSSKCLFLHETPLSDIMWRTPGG
jgi:hypothetical protein